MHRPPYIFFHFHSNNPLRASSSSEEKAISKRTVLLRVSQQGLRGGHLTPLLLWRMLKAVFGGGGLDD